MKKKKKKQSRFNFDVEDNNSTNDLREEKSLLSRNESLIENDVFQSNNTLDNNDESDEVSLLQTRSRPKVSFMDQTESKPIS